MRCFSSPGLPLSIRRGAGIASGGLPHSEIRALTGMCPYTRLIAACHVLHRFREPRHPSCALLCFIFTVLFFTTTSYTLQRHMTPPRSFSVILLFEMRFVSRLQHVNLRSVMAHHIRSAPGCMRTKPMDRTLILRTSAPEQKTVGGIYRADDLSSVTGHAVSPTTCSPWQS